MCKGIPLVKNDFFGQKRFFGQTRAFRCAGTSLTADGGGSRSAPVSRYARARRCALASRRKGLILGILGI